MAGRQVFADPRRAEAGALRTVRAGLEELSDAAKRLDKLYIPTRYPNGLPDMTPGEVFTSAEAEAAAEASLRMIDRAAGLIAAEE